jgi:cell division protein ZipA
MSTLQWALLIVAIVAVIAIYIVSRRGKPPVAGKAVSVPMTPVATRLPAGDQMEIFSRTGDFDEFGVGKPRRRVAPSVSGAPTILPSEDNADPAPLPGVPTALAMGKPKTATVVEEAPKAKPVEHKIFAILIAEREGGLILGNNLHRALRKEALVFGERKIYHRMDMGQPVFSVAGLLKPGQLDPAESESFSTPGLTMFMVLPGPPSPAEAVRDLLNTAKALAKSLKGELFDNKRQPFTEESERAMLADIEDWARRNA